MRNKPHARIAATLLAATLAGTVLAARDSDGYPPPPGPYRSGPWTGAAEAPTVPPAMPAESAQSSMATGSMLLPPMPLADDPADYSATTLFGAAPEPTLPEAAPLPAWPETPLAASATRPPRPAYAPIGRRPDFGLGAADTRPPSDFSIGTTRPQQRSTAGQSPRFAAPMGPADSRDFASLPSTLPDSLPMPERMGPLVAPSDSWSIPGAMIPEPAPATTARAFTPSPPPPVTMPSPPREMPGGVNAETDVPVFRPPSLIAD